MSSGTFGDADAYFEVGSTNPATIDLDNRISLWANDLDVAGVLVSSTDVTIKNSPNNRAGGAAYVARASKLHPAAEIIISSSTFTNCGSGGAITLERDYPHVDGLGFDNDAFALGPLTTSTSLSVGVTRDDLGTKHSALAQAGLFNAVRPGLRSPSRGVGPCSPAPENPATPRSD